MRQASPQCTAQGQPHSYTGLSFLFPQSRGPWGVNGSERGGNTPIITPHFFQSISYPSSPNYPSNHATFFFGHFPIFFISSLYLMPSYLHYFGDFGCFVLLFAPLFSVSCFLPWVVLIWAIIVIIGFVLVIAYTSCGVLYVDFCFCYWCFFMRGTDFHILLICWVWIISAIFFWGFTFVFSGVFWRGGEHQTWYSRFCYRRFVCVACLFNRLFSLDRLFSSPTVCFFLWYVFFYFDYFFEESGIFFPLSPSFVETECLLTEFSDLNCIGL